MIKVIKLTEKELADDTVYYGQEANWQYMSVSQYKDFRACQGAALAKLKGDWQPTMDNQALLVGQYVHSYFESAQAHQAFKEENKDKLFKKNGELYKAFEIAEAMIKRLKRDDFFNYLWQGEKEVVVTGELYGTNWKGKIDCLNVDQGYFIDLKTNAKFDKRYWNTDWGGWVSFVEEFGYVLQIAIYEKLLEMKYNKPFEGFIIAVSKEEPPNLEAIQITDLMKETELQFLERRLDGVLKVKHGELVPDHCGKCEYCRTFKELSGFVIPEILID